MTSGSAPQQAPIYETSPDRAGLALGVGGVLGGMLVVALVAFGAGQHQPLALAGAFILGTIFSALGIAFVAGPVWLVLHLAGYRGLIAAALVGVITALIAFVFGQTYGFGLYEMPATDSRTLMFRWASAAATSLILACIAGAIGMVMWRVAYRRVA